jgi:hypothetical protein
MSDGLAAHSMPWPWPARNLRPVVIRLAMI